MFGIRTSLWVAVMVALLATLIGTAVGAVAGYYSGQVDNLLMRSPTCSSPSPALPSC